MEEINRLNCHIHRCWYFLRFRDSVVSKRNVRKPSKNIFKFWSLLSFQCFLRFPLVYFACKYIINWDNLYHLLDIQSFINCTFEKEKSIWSSTNWYFQYVLWYYLGSYDCFQSVYIFRQIDLYYKLIWNYKY